MNGNINKLTLWIKGVPIHKLPSQIEKKLQLSLTDLSIDTSLVLGCVFYKTNNPNVFLTNYDILEKQDLTFRDLWELLYFDIDNSVMSNIKVSFEYLNDASIEDFSKVIMRVASIPKNKFVITK